MTISTTNGGLSSVDINEVVKEELRRIHATEDQEPRDVTLLRGLTRLFEDYIGNDEAVGPERRLDFSRITRSFLEPITPDWDANYIQRGAQLALLIPLARLIHLLLAELKRLRGCADCEITAAMDGMAGGAEVCSKCRRCFKYHHNDGRVCGEQSEDA